MRSWTFVLAVVIVPLLGYTQNEIHGKVVDELGLPIYLASVVLEDTKVGVYTDFDGNFLLESEQPFHWQILISSTGYQPESFFVLSGGYTGELILKYGEEMNALLVDDP
ncbi:MAG: carboxypeptidase-like regulatory domain-containing protein [Bacteroidota bacterium]